MDHSLVKLMLCRATQDGWVIVESLIKHAPPGEGDSKPLQYPCLENPMNIRERQKDTKHKIDHFNYLLSSQFSGIKHIDYHYLFLELFHPPKRKLFIH